MDRVTHESGGHPRIAVILCAVLEVEIETLVKDMPRVVHIEKMEQGLHNEPDRLRKELQAAIGRVEADCDADVIVLGYGLCCRGTVGLTTTRCRLVVPRAHDCITLLLGSKERYAKYVAEHPGTYWYSPGWNKHHTPPGEERYHTLRKAYAQKYGEDNADYLMECEQNWFKTYDRAVYVHLSTGATDRDKAYTKGCADWLGWGYDEQAGDPALVRALVSGDWDAERFLVVEPGQITRMTCDDRIIEAVAQAGGETV
jgi:Protein of unknown function (DUF1638)